MMPRLIMLSHSEVECRPSSSCMTSTQRSAETTKSTGPAFINLSEIDYAIGDGKDDNIQCGENWRQAGKKASTTLVKSLPKSYGATSKDVRDSFEGMSITNTFKKRSLEVKTINYETLIAEYEAARSKAREWENFVYQTFSKSDQLSIMGLLAYLENKERGFGRHNDEKVFASIRKGDVCGQLFAEATRGFDFSKKYIVLAPLVWEIKARRRLKK
jgi:hypothetical protein